MIKPYFILYILLLLPKIFYSQNENNLSHPGYALSFFDAENSRKAYKGIRITILGSNGIKPIELKENRLGNFIIPKTFDSDSIQFLIKYKSVIVKTKFYTYALLKNGGEIQIGNILNYKKQVALFSDDDKKLELLNNKNLYYYIITNEFIKNSFKNKPKLNKLKYVVIRPNMTGIGGVFYDYNIY